MGNLFSQSSDSSHRKRPVITDADKAILDLKLARKQLVHCKSQQEELAVRSRAAAAALVKACRKERALLALKKRKLHERQALALDGNILKLDEQVIALETSQQQADTVGALRVAAAAMRALRQQMPLAEVEKLLEESAEGAEYVEQVNALLAQSSGTSAEAVRESEVDVELDALEAELLGERLDALPAAPVVQGPVTTADAPQGEASTLESASSEAVAVASQQPAAPEALAGVASPQGGMASAQAGSLPAGSGGEFELDTELRLPDAPTHQAVRPNLEDSATAEEVTEGEEVAERIPVPA